jgi:hypothetical protein
MSDGPAKRLPFRWLSLAELVGLAAVVIAALGYWDAHRERAEEDRARAAQAAREQKAETAKPPPAGPAFLMTGTVDAAGGKVRLAPVHADQVIQTQTLWFPKDIRADSVETIGNPRLEAGWIDAHLGKASGKARQGRLPVGISTVFIEDGQTLTDRSVYWLAYRLHPRLLRRPHVELEGLSLRQRQVAGDLQAAVDGVWAARPGAPAAQGSGSDEKKAAPKDGQS